MAWLGTSIEDEIDEAMARMAQVDPSFDRDAWRSYEGQPRGAVCDGERIYATVGAAKVSQRTRDDLVFWIAKEAVTEHVERRIAASTLTPKDRIDFRQKHTRALLEAAGRGWGGRPRGAWPPTSAEALKRAAQRAQPLPSLAEIPRPTNEKEEARAIERVVSDVALLSTGSGSASGWMEQGDGAIYVSVASGGYHVRYNGKDGNRHIASHASRDAIARALIRDVLTDLHDLDRLEELYARARPSWF